jgi:hypothetical protein
MNKNEYLFSCLLKIYDKKFEEMEYDLQYEKVKQLYLEFLESKFNVDTKSEYMCIIDFLKVFMLTAKENQTTTKWLVEQIDNRDMGEIPMWIYDLCHKATLIEKEKMTNFALKFMMQDKPVVSFYNETFE